MDKLRHKALGYLARREHSRCELKRKLQGAGTSSELEALLLALTAEGLQSDGRFVESFIHSKVQSGHGPARITQELRQHGIDNSLIDQYLVENAIDWQQHLQQVWQKKYHNSIPDTQKELARQVRFLLSRGFSQSMVLKFLSRNKLD